MELLQNMLNDNQNYEKILDLNNQKKEKKYLFNYIIRIILWILILLTIVIGFVDFFFNDLSSSKSFLKTVTTKMNHEEKQLIDKDYLKAVRCGGRFVIIVDDTIKGIKKLKQEIEEINKTKKTDQLEVKIKELESKQDQLNQLIRYINKFYELENDEILPHQTPSTTQRSSQIYNETSSFLQPLTEEEKTINHELGHALVTKYFGQKVKEVNIEPKGDALGFTAYSLLKSDSSQYLLKNIIISYGGRAAEEIWPSADDPQKTNSGSKFDFKEALQLATQYCRENTILSDSSSSDSNNEDSFDLLDQNFINQQKNDSIKRLLTESYWKAKDILKQYDTEKYRSKLNYLKDQLRQQKKLTDKYFSNNEGFFMSQDKKNFSKDDILALSDPSVKTDPLPFNVLDTKTQNSYTPLTLNSIIEKILKTLEKTNPQDQREMILKISLGSILAQKKFIFNHQNMSYTNTFESSYLKNNNLKPVSSDYLKAIYKEVNAIIEKYKPKFENIVQTLLKNHLLSETDLENLSLLN